MTRHVFIPCQLGQLGIVGNGTSSIVELEQLLTKTRRCLKTIADVGEFRLWLNQKATMSPIVSTTGSCFFNKSPFSFVEKIANFCTKDIPNLKIWPTFPGRRCESSTSGGRIGQLWRHAFHRRQGRNNRCQRTYISVLGGSFDGESKADQSLSTYIVVYLSLSMYLYIRPYLLFQLWVTPLRHYEHCGKCLILCHRICMSHDAENQAAYAKFPPLEDLPLEDIAGKPFQGKTSGRFCN